MIRVWDVEQGTCIHQLTGHLSLTSGMQLRGNILVSGNADSTVKIWNIDSGKCLHTLAGEKNLSKEFIRDNVFFFQDEINMHLQLLGYKLY